jgi:hypothetical protein
MSSDQHPDAAAAEIGELGVSPAEPSMFPTAPEDIEPLDAHASEQPPEAADATEPTEPTEPTDPTDVAEAAGSAVAADGPGQPPVTGDPAVDAALVDAATVRDADPATQLEKYVGTHRALQDRLADSGA